MHLYTIIKSFLQQKSAILLMVFGLFCFSNVMTSCGGPKSGCPINESTTGKVNRRGELSNKKGKSNLFPKKVRKKMRTK